MNVSISTGERPGPILLVLLVLFALPVSGIAPVDAQLSAGQSLPGVWAASTTWADLDGDGDPDLLLTGLTGPGDDCRPIARVYRNDGGTLVDQDAGLPGVVYGDAAFGDYDGDGDLDLALSGVTAAGDGTVRLFRNEGGGFSEDLSQSVLLAETMRYSALAWGDYDGDGDPDLLASGMTAAGNARTVLFNNGRIDASRVGSPLGGTPLLSIDEPNSQRLVNLNQGSLAWGDIDGDGDLDLALTGYGTDGGRRSALYVNEPLGTLTLDTRNTGLPALSGGDLAWGDYDNDGDLDLAVSGWSTTWDATFQVFRNAAGILREDRTFSARRIVGALAWGDVDNDGDLDLAASGQTNTSDRRTFVLVNDSAGTLTEDASQPLTGARGGDVAWADVDGDDRLDLVVAGEVDGETRETTVYLNAGGSANQAPEPPDRLGVPFVTSRGVTLDWNDGTDAESASTGLTYTLRIGTSEGGHDVFTGAVPVGPGNVGASKTLNLSIPLARDTYYWAVRTVDPGYAVSVESQEELFRVQDLVSSPQNLRPLRDAALDWGDYDNDGDPDLLLAGRDVDNRGRTILYRNDDGILTENAGAVFQGLLGGDAAWGDYDNDGDLDLAIVGTDASGNRFSHLYRNRLDVGDFALNITNVRALAQLGSGAVAWGDYDNDGDLDLAAMGQVAGGRITTVYRNDNGAFVEDSALDLAGADNGDLAWGDYDGDGDLDLAVVGQVSNDFSAALRIYANDPVGTLTEDIRSDLSGAFASSLAWGDYDGDGDLDLVVSGFDGSANARVTRLYDNDGTGRLTENLATAFTGGAATDVAWGDIDNDGDLDIALSGNGLDGPFLQVYRNTGVAFQPESIDVLRGIDFGAIGWADIDTDGDLDLVSAGRSSFDGVNFELTSRANDNLESRFNPNEPPVPPGGLVSTTSGADVALDWMPAQDAGTAPTPVAGLTYEIRVGPEPGSHAIRSGVAAEAFGSIRSSDIVLRDLPSGGYFWSVRAIDSGLARSAWSEEAGFIVDTVRPVVDSIQVRPRVLTGGRRASVVVDFSDEPAGMDNDVSPTVTLQIASQTAPLTLTQLSYSGDLWIGEADVEADVPAGSITVGVTGAADRKGNVMEPFEQTIPALIASGQGGVVESADGRVSLRISPNVLPDDLTRNPDVRIDSVPVGPEPPGTVAAHGAYRITSDPPVTLRKAATLVFRTPADVPADRLAVYRLTGTTWERLGGTGEGDAVRVPVTEIATYGLFEEAPGTAGDAAVSNIQFSNRAFSPAGAGAGRPSALLLQTTDIAFDLSAPASVRIEIYDRAGRLQRILEPGRPMNAGRNLVTWDGRDHDGERVRSGLYIVMIEADGEREQKTVAVVNQ